MNHASGRHVKKKKEKWSRTTETNIGAAAAAATASTPDALHRRRLYPALATPSPRTSSATTPLYALPSLPPRPSTPSNPRSDLVDGGPRLHDCFHTHPTESARTPTCPTPTTRFCSHQFDLTEGRYLIPGASDGSAAVFVLKNATEYKVGFVAKHRNIRQEA